LKGGRKKSSFSEEKEAKRLYFLSPAPASPANANTLRRRGHKSLLVLFFRKEHFFL
jgi:hypothetical protein